jgi:hypothetical protein
MSGTSRRQPERLRSAIEQIEFAVHADEYLTMGVQQSVDVSPILYRTANSEARDCWRAEASRSSSDRKEATSVLTMYTVRSIRKVRSNP